MQHTAGSRATNQYAAERGFTLVELMVVVAIIALIATIIIPNFVHARQEAQVATSEANLKQIATSLELYYSDKDDYPDGAGISVTPVALYGGPDNPYLEQTPIDPVDGQDYIYTHGGGVATGDASYVLDAPGAYDAASLANLGTCPFGTAAGDTTLHYGPQSGVCKL
jgi:general secretion pathway protein G